jgi:hypothetical protein
MSSSRIAILAAKIYENTVVVDDYLSSKGLPSPSFDERGPLDLGIEAEEVRKASEVARESSLELHDLLLGPALCLRPLVTFCLDFQSNNALTNMIAVQWGELSGSI